MTDHEFVDDVHVVEFCEGLRLHDVENLHNVCVFEVAQQLHLTQSALGLNQIGKGWSSSNGNQQDSGEVSSCTAAAASLLTVIYASSMP
jgi:hypothetical protein